MKVFGPIIAVVIVLSAPFIASAADSTFRVGAQYREEVPPVYYGVGTPCVLTTGYHAITATVDEGEVVHMLILSRQGFFGWSRNRVTSAIKEVDLEVVEKECDGTLLLLPNKEREAIRPFLLAKK